MDFELLFRLGQAKTSKSVGRSSRSIPSVRTDQAGTTPLSGGCSMDVRSKEIQWIALTYSLFHCYIIFIMFFFFFFPKVYVFIFIITVFFESLCYQHKISSKMIWSFMMFHSFALEKFDSEAEEGWPSSRAKRFRRRTSRSAEEFGRLREANGYSWIWMHINVFQLPGGFCFFLWIDGVTGCN